MVNLCEQSDRLRSSDYRRQVRVGGFSPDFIGIEGEKKRGGALEINKNFCKIILRIKNHMGLNFLTPLQFSKNILNLKELKKLNYKF